MTFVTKSVAPLADGEPKQDARGRILAVARELVARKGPHATTVRDITDATGMNVASVNYYFRSKRALIEEVLISIFAPVNSARVDLLLEAETRHAPNPVPVVDILHALVRPLIDAEPGSNGGSLYLRALQHLRTPPGEEANIFVFSTFDPVAQHFIAALHRTLPHLTRTEIAWRYELARGGAVHVLSNCEPLSTKMHHLTRESGLLDPAQSDKVLAEVIAFAAAGFAAPPQMCQDDLVSAPALLSVDLPI